MPLNVKSKSARRRRKGFSLLEALVVLAIIALVASVVGPRAVSFFSRAKSKTADLQIKELESALELYFLDTGHYPAETTGLGALVSSPAGEPRWNGPYVKQASALTDPWSRPYRYRYPGQFGEFDLYTLGRDGSEGGGGEDADITSW